MESRVSTSATAALCSVSRVTRLRTVLLLGVPHFDNPGPDMANVEMDDVLSSTRQAEIWTIIDDLLGFEPTVVAVERPRREPGSDRRGVQGVVCRRTAPRPIGS